MYNSVAKKVIKSESKKLQNYDIWGVTAGVMQTKIKREGEMVADLTENR